MVISKNEYSMEVKRSFTTGTKTVNATAYGTTASLTENLQELNTEFEERRDSAGNNSFKSKLETISKSEEYDYLNELSLGDSGFSLNKRNNISLVNQNSVSSINNEKKIFQQTLMYLLLRLRKILYGQNGPNEGVSEWFNLAKGQSTYTYDESVNIVGKSYLSNSYYENENLAFSTTGKVITEDGRELNFNVELQMSRSLVKKVESVRDIAAVSVNNLVDPLVINLEGNTAELKDQKFYFDLDNDGEEEEISELGEKSGFLALDKNNDGKINNGGELFGTKSGNGFKDLAEYDLDNNGWIDEADEIFDKLIIWCKDENGSDKMYKLKDMNIGAICLDNVNTNFSLKNDKTINGIIRHTGFFLYENGTASTIQHLDMTS